MAQAHCCMYSQLMGAACMGKEAHICKSFLFCGGDPYSFPVGKGLLSILIVHYLPRSMLNVEAHGKINVSPFLFNDSLQQGHICLLDLPLFKLHHKVLGAFLVEGKDHK